jgi:riboflavin biosynthesis pyrimidine reductase
VEPLALLYEPDGLDDFALPSELATLYPGTFGVGLDVVYANFVQTIDGAAALPDLPRANRLIADESRADLFVMALLRACADAVLVGAGTVRAAPSNRWTAEAAFPDGAGALSAFRRGLGLAPEPIVAVLSRSGDLAGAADTLGERLLVLDTSGPAAVLALRERGHRRILCEGGPTVFGELLAAGAVDELFLTISPLFAGRDVWMPFASIAEGVVLLPEARIAAHLAGVRTHGDHLFLRYAFA